MNIENIERIELEITSDCNAACPGCARTQNLDLFTPQHITFEQIKKWFPDKRHIEDKRFKLCGVLGDPIVNPDCLKITEWLVYNGGYVQYSTNGGKQPIEFWRRLGQVSEQSGRVKVHFCVDGHRETNHIYRVNTVYDVIDRNMEAYSSAGGLASWIYIVFDHNEYELEIAKKRAAELKFDFATRTGMRNSYHDWVANIKKKSKVEKKVITEQKTITTTGAKEHSKVEVIKELDKFIQSETKTDEQIDEIVSSISCKFYHDKEIFLAADGTLWPCCFLWDSYFKNKDKIVEKYSEFKKNWNDLNHHSIDEVLSTKYYEQTLADSFDPRHNKHISRCIRTCAKNRAYHNEIKYI